MSTASSVRAAATSGPVAAIAALGQSVWFDNIRRGLLTSGEFERMVREDGVTGVRSNPSIFEKAIVGSTDYDEALTAARATSASFGDAPDVKSVYEAMAIVELRQAMDVPRPVYEDTDGVGGYVSMEVAPDLAHDTAGTVAEAQRLWAAVDRPNLMIKVPGTEEGISAIRELIAQGINVNITLLFSIPVYEQVAEAYLAGLEDRLATGEPIGGIASVSKNDKSVIPVDREPLGDPGVYGKDRPFVYPRLAADNDADQEKKVTALEAAGHPVVRIVLADLADLGGEFFRWEFATAVAGSILRINPFNQPDVEDAKIVTRTLTDAYDDTQSLPDPVWFADADGMRLAADDRNTAELQDIAGTKASVGGFLAAQLGRVAQGDYVALLAYLPMTAENEQLLTDTRVLIRDRLHVATCVGFGPRFQHSTGQAYKGGPNIGVFLQLTCTDPGQRPHQRSEGCCAMPWHASWADPRHETETNHADRNGRAWTDGGEPGTAVVAGRPRVCRVRRRRRELLLPRRH